MTKLRAFHTYIFDFATQVTTAIESQRGGSDRSSQVTATIAFAGDGSRKFTISHTTGQTTQLRRVPLWDYRTMSAESGEYDECISAGGRAPPHRQTIKQGATTRHHSTSGNAYATA